MGFSRRQFLALSSLTAATFVSPKLLGGSNVALAAVADPYAELDAVAQAGLVRSGEASALELLEATIRRIEAINPRINAVVTKAYDRAREQAKSGTLSGPFGGVPFLVKDLNDVAGIRTTSACRAMMDFIPEKTDTYIQACIDAGFNVCGKTNTPEFGLAATTESLALGPCHNPWDLVRSSGGSSGGTGAAVASGMVALAHGNDGGGSIRIPASCCGIFGLKSSRGRLAGSSAGFGLAVQGGLSRSVRDSAHLIAHTENEKLPRSLERTGLVEGPAKRRLKIGMYLEGSRDQQPTADVAEAIQSTATLCKELGHEVVEAKIEYDTYAMVDNFLTLWASSGGEVADAFEEEFNRAVTVQDLEPLTLAFSDLYHGGGREKMGEAVKSLIALSKSIDEQMKPYDVLLCPVLSSVPPVIGEQAPSVPYEILIERMFAYVAYTPIFNITGMPAMSVPLYWNAEGLPIGSQFAAKTGDDRMLLELAYELEAARPWADRRPPIFAGATDSV